MGVVFDSIFTIIQVSLLLIVFATIILNNILDYHHPAADHLPVDIAENWNQRLVLDMVPKESEKCPDNYEPLVLDIWNGTNEGCDCTSIMNSDISSERMNQITKGNCSFEMAVAKCKYIASQSRVNLTFWRGISLCAKYFNNSYEKIMQNELTAANTSCKENEVFCGIIDTYGNKLCLEKEEKCPINKIIIQEAMPSEEYIYKTIPLSNGFNLFFTNQAINNSLIAEVRLSEGFMCLNSQRKGSSARQYPLLNDYDYFGCDSPSENHIKDTRFIPLDVNTKRNVYIDNSLMPIVSSLPRYNLSSLDTDMFLYYRPYIGFHAEFLQAEAIHPQDIQNALIIDPTFARLITGFGSLFLFIMCPLIGVKLCTENTTEEFLGLECIMLVINLGYVSFNGVDYMNYRSQINNISKYIIGDSITNQILGDLIEKELATMKTFRLMTSCILLFVSLCSPFSLLINNIIKNFRFKSIGQPQQFTEVEMREEESR